MTRRRKTTEVTVKLTGSTIGTILTGLLSADSVRVTRDGAVVARFPDGRQAAAFAGRLGRR